MFTLFRKSVKKVAYLADAVFNTPVDLAPLIARQRLAQNHLEQSGFNAKEAQTVLKSHAHLHGGPYAFNSWKKQYSSALDPVAATTKLGNNNR